METFRATLKNSPKSGREAYYALYAPKGVKTAILAVSMAFSCCGESKSARNVEIISEIFSGTSNSPENTLWTIEIA